MSHDIDVAITYRGPNPTIDLECSGCGWTKNMGITTSPEAIAEAESQHLFDVVRARITWAPPQPRDIQVWQSRFTWAPFRPIGWCALINGAACAYPTEAAALEFWAHER